MFKNYIFRLFFVFILVSLVFSCSSDDTDDYEPIPSTESPVEVDLASVPYAKLSDYKFFEGDLKLQKPSIGVLPYEPASSLFTDYALKKRFVWMPKNTQATYNGDGEVFLFPTGAVLIKTFYYENVQPSNVTKIIETRLMIKKENEWIFANYIWNNEQTEAYLDATGQGANVDVAWIDNGVSKQTNYRIPATPECFMCHKIVENEAEVAIPIGPKPQNLNTNYAYTSGSQNQLSKWIGEGYLENNLPASIVSVVDYRDSSQDIEMRVRSYVDANCAHCHRDNSHCSYREVRFAFNETSNPSNLGVCLTPGELLNDDLSLVVAPGNISKSSLHFRLNTNEEDKRMPLRGRTMIHQEGVDLITEWINSLEPCN